MADKKTEELSAKQLDRVSGGAATEELFGAYSVVGNSKGVTTGGAKASRDVVIKGKKILQN
ncbi:hypothetical protein [Sphingorhabdus sp. Alg231-15]|uniref:hypothetical protein n=1 Tax=Sphingorhabdus sp. Alg231-15 TaxID=1922222 RepID=UPI000D55735D